MKLALKIAKWTLCIVIVLLILVFNVPIPVRIETTALEIIYTNPDHLEERTVIIQGWYHLNIREPRHVFRGTFTVLEYPETHIEMHNRRLDLTPWFGNTRSGILFYPEYPYSLLDMMPFGIVYSGFLFRDTIIWVTSVHGTLSQAPLIVLGATSHDDAVNRVKPFFYPALR